MIKLNPEELAVKFIACFSKKCDKESVTGPWKEELNAEQKALLIQEFQKMEFQNSSTELVLIGQGRHNKVFALSQVPFYAIKRMDKKLAYHQLASAKRAHEYVISQNCFWIQTPSSACVVDLPNSSDALYIEERLPLGMNIEEHCIFFERIFNHLESEDGTETFKKNLRKLVKQICKFAENTGFRDIGLGHNLPEVSLTGTHVCVTDFEEMDLSNSVEDIYWRLSAAFHSPLLSDKIKKRFQKKVLENIYKKELVKYEERKKYFVDREWSTSILLPPTRGSIVQDYDDRVAINRRNHKSFVESILSSQGFR